MHDNECLSEREPNIKMFLLHLENDDCKTRHSETNNSQDKLLSDDVDLRTEISDVKLENIQTITRCSSRITRQTQ